MGFDGRPYASFDRKAASGAEHGARHRVNRDERAESGALREGSARRAWDSGASSTSPTLPCVVGTPRSAAR